MLGQVWVLYSIAGAALICTALIVQIAHRDGITKNSARMQNGFLPIVFRAANKTDSLRFQTLPS